MEKIQTNSTEKFKETVNGVDINVRKVTNSSNLTIYGELSKNNTPAGNFSYDKAVGYINISFKPVDVLTTEEQTAICSKVPGWIDELKGTAE